MTKAITIAGGGLAGLACAIRLQERGVQVTVHERKSYPLKKVCGEFLSPGGWQRLQELGAEPFLPQAPTELRRVRFYADESHSVDFALKPFALGLSRHAMDTALARRFQQLGGTLRENSKYEGEADGVTVIDARGKPGLPGESAWVGWRAYLPAGAAPTDFQSVDLVMLPVPEGYCGFSRIEDGRYNVCLVARTPVVINQLLASHPVLAGIADRLEPFAAIASFDFRNYPGPGRLGDRRSVWPPLVGDGMSRALSAGMEQAQALLENRPPRRTSTLGGFILAKSLHTLMMSAPLRQVGLRVTRVYPRIAESLFRTTRVG
ncbi:MAG: NAD(P)-binding protein [bacterium]|nr:NAD(P)-binding protein [bacterium]MDI1336798.1 NAD(P)-binding protein [Lacunisphaera sp.]